MDQVLSPLVVTSDPRVFNQQLPEPPGPRCELAPWGGPELVPALVCALCCFFSVVYCCFGYRCFKAVMFLSGLFAGSLVIFLLCYRERVLETQLSLEVSAGIALGIGLLCGLVTVLVRSVGLFLTGLLLGLALGAGALLATEPWYRPPSAWVPAGLLVGLALLGALMTLRWPRPFTILGTALLGAAGLVACADYLVEGLALGGRLGQRLRAVPGLPPLCWYSWALLGAWPALGTLGAVAQWRLTAEGRGRPDGKLKARGVGGRGSRGWRGGGRRRLGSRRRPPAPQSYLRSLRDRPRAPRSAPHTVLDLDYDSGSTTPLTAPPAGRP
uniref:Transmembrane protein 198 n=1 Tax=Ornithorhynchus anatinus TaxID=9258 RepID=A0A6I8PEY1_ORNAN